MDFCKGLFAPQWILQEVVLIFFHALCITEAEERS